MLYGKIDGDKGIEAEVLRPESDHVIHQVGSKYAIQDFIRKNEKALETEDLYFDTIGELRGMLLKKQKSGACVDTMVKEIISKIDTCKNEFRDTSLEHRRGKVLGKRCDNLVFHQIINGQLSRMENHPKNAHVEQRGIAYASSPKKSQKSIQSENAPDDLEEMGLIESSNEDIFVHVMHEYFVSQKKCEEHYHASGAIFHRHAFERFYEREELETGQVLSAIKEWVEPYTKALSFAYAAQIYSRPLGALGTDKVKFETIRPVTGIPCSNGMMIVEMTQIVQKAHSFNVALSKNNMRIRSECFHPDIVINVGNKAEIFNSAVAITYISDSMMCELQREWLDTFLEEMEQHDIDKIRRDIMGMREPHKHYEKQPAIESEKITWLKNNIGRVATEKRRKGQWNILNW